MAFSPSPDARKPINGHHHRDALDMGLLARINSLNEASARESDDDCEVVAEEDARLSHSIRNGSREARRLANNGPSQHEISELEEKVEKALQAADISIARAQSQGGGSSECCPCSKCQCSCHDRGQQRPDHHLSNPYARSPKVYSPSKGGPAYNPKKYDFWYEISTYTKGEVALVLALPFATCAAIYLWAKALGF